MSSLKYKFRQIKKFPTWLYWFPAQLMKIYCYCFFRKKIIDKGGILADLPHGGVGMVWHNRLFFMPFAFPKWMKRTTCAMISPSRDGQYLVDFIHHLGVRAVRGSSRDRAAKVLLGSTREIEAGHNIIITPDGPRGPRYKLQNGPVYLTSVTQTPLVPMAINYSRYWQLRSWDGFQIPKPFAKVTVIVGEPIKVPPDLDAEGIEHYRQLAEKAMMEITVDSEAIPEKLRAANPAAAGKPAQNKTDR